MPNVSLRTIYSGSMIKIIRILLQDMYKASKDNISLPEEHDKHVNKYG